MKYCLRWLFMWRSKYLACTALSSNSHYNTYPQKYLNYSAATKEPTADRFSRLHHHRVSTKFQLDYYVWTKNKSWPATVVITCWGSTVQSRLSFLNQSEMKEIYWKSGSSVLKQAENANVLIQLVAWVKLCLFMNSSDTPFPLSLVLVFDWFESSSSYELGV